MKVPKGIRVLLVLLPLAIPLSLALPGCGGEGTTTGSNTNTLKTPDDVLREAQAKDAAAKAAPK